MPGTDMAAQRWVMRTPPRSKTFRVVRGVVIAAVGLFAFYLLVGNVLIGTRLLRDAVSAHPEELVLDYDSAYTLFPGHVKVKGLKLKYEDRALRFGLGIEEAHVRIALTELVRKRFQAIRVRGTGISWRMIHKVEKLEGNEKRVAAFPVIEGFEKAPILGPEPEGPPSTGEGNWTVAISDVDVQVSEIWMLEYRYAGTGRASGSFEITPSKMIWVGPAFLELKEGLLSTGEKALSKNFGLQAEVTIDPFDVPKKPGLKVLSSLSATVKIAALLDDVGTVELYVPELEASGNGTLTVDVRVKNGILDAASAIEVHVDGMKLRSKGAGFDGTLNVAFKLGPDAKGLSVPVGHAAVAGSVLVPIAKDTTVTAVLSGTAADLALVSADISQGFELGRLRAKMGEARVDDARAITKMASKSAPVIAPAVLGDGPLTASCTADVTKGKTVVRLKHAKLGDAELTGAAVSTGDAWNGAAAGRVAVVPLGVQVTSGTPKVVPFITEGWLSGQLEKLGIFP